MLKGAWNKVRVAAGSLNSPIEMIRLDHLLDDTSPSAVEWVVESKDLTTERPLTLTELSGQYRFATPRSESIHCLV